jgi:hypothetical protein
MIISKDTGTASNQIQYPFTIKVSKKLAMERLQSNIIKDIYDKTIANIYQMGKTENSL